MGTKLENTAKREADLEKMDAQLKVWSTQIDDLVAGYLEAGSQPNDEVRLRVDALQTRHGVVRAKISEFTAPSSHGGSFTALRAAIKQDWSALAAGLKALAR